MPRPKHEGAEYVAKNGYRYVKQDGKWRPKSHVVAEEDMGRSLEKDERVLFKNGDNTDFSPDNLIVKKKTVGKAARIAYLKSKIVEYTEELALLEKKSKV